MAGPQQQAGQPISLENLSLQQLSSVKKQLDDELEHLTASFTKLRAAQAKFQECRRSIQSGLASINNGKMILVPLTTSLYVPGKLCDLEKVIVDIGTGFYVEKSKSEADVFYKSKIDDLSSNLKDLEGVVQGKSNNLRIVEDVLRKKVISNNTSTSSD